MTDRSARERAEPLAEDGKIGPNAVIQLVAALKAADLESRLAPVFQKAGVAAWLDAPPSVMVDACPVGELHRAIRTSLPLDRAAALMADAGRRTADYLLGARIPRPVQVVLKLLPPRLAAMVLVAAIRAHAWTFAGAGRFTAALGRRPCCGSRAIRCVRGRRRRCPCATGTWRCSSACLRFWSCPPPGSPKPHVRPAATTAAGSRYAGTRLTRAPVASS